jgi:hypothetical protein
MENALNISQIQERILIWHKKYQSYIPALFFLSGFLFDLMTIGDIDELINILTQATYLIVAGHILYLDSLGIKETKNKYYQYYLTYKEDIFHFLLGSLLSAFTIFYFKSASLANSFIFMFILTALLLLNELPTFQSLGAIFRSALYMLCLISYFIYVIPIIFGQTGIIYFSLALILAVLFILFKYYLLKRIQKDHKQLLREIIIPQISILVIFLLLYITRLIPPVPLSIKHIGIYHNVEKDNDSYITFDYKPWYNFWSNGDQSFKARPDDKVYVFTKVFAPAGFDGKVYIHWLKETDDGLKTSDRIPLKITGGRREGFRGYAFKENYTEGDWQIRIETKLGLEIGRIYLSVEKDTTSGKREWNIKKQI